MRKIVLFAAAVFTAVSVTAQTGEITSNKGENWLSQDGDWGLTIDAWPFLNYAGNLFNGTQGNQPPSWSSLMTWDPYNDLDGTGSPSMTRAIIGVKKLMDANTAYRGKVRIGFGSDKTTVLVDDANDDEFALVEDVTKTGETNIVLGVGLEKRVGSSRVVGVYGAEFCLGIGSKKTSYEYGNSIDDSGQSSRTTEVKYGGAFMVGLGVFVGVEWFCAPKMSLSAEYGWGLAMESKGFDETSYEYADGVDGPGSLESGTKTNSFGIDTNENGVSIGMNFYFQ